MVKTVFKKFGILAALLGLIIFSSQAYASGGEAEFGEIYQKLTDWSQGTLGKLLCLICIVVGMAFTVTRGTLIWAVIGIAMSLVLYNAPTVIDSLMDATVMENLTENPSLHMKWLLSNGLLI